MIYMYINTNNNTTFFVLACSEKEDEKKENEERLPQKTQTVVKFCFFNIFIRYKLNYLNLCVCQLTPRL